MLYGAMVDAMAPLCSIEHIPNHYRDTCSGLVHDGTLVILEKSNDKNGVDDTNGINFVTQCHIQKKWFWDGGYGITGICNGIEGIAHLLL
jgi:hypothetical protein